MKQFFCAAAALLLTLASPAVAADSDPALWVVKDEDTTIYLFGTVHVLKPGLSWFDEGVKEAFDKSDTLVLEMLEPAPEQMQALVAAKGLSMNGPALSAKLAPEDRADYEKAMAGLGLPVAAFERMKPWMAAVTLAVMPLGKLGYDDKQGAETILTDAAKSAGKPIEGLETAEQQLGFFDALPENSQIAFLNSTVDELPTLGDTMAKMVESWSRGDAAALAELMNESLDDTPELAKILLVDRNARWAQWIGQRMAKPGTIFMAVGAGHLAGDHSVQNQLKAARIEAKRVDY